MPKQYKRLFGQKVEESWFLVTEVSSSIPADDGLCSASFLKIKSSEGRGGYSSTMLIMIVITIVTINIKNADGKFS